MQMAPSKNGAVGSLKRLWLDPRHFQCGLDGDSGGGVVLLRGPLALGLDMKPQITRVLEIALS